MCGVPVERPSQLPYVRCIMEGPKSLFYTHTHTRTHARTHTLTLSGMWVKSTRMWVKSTRMWVDTHALAHAHMRASMNAGCARACALLSPLSLTQMAHTHSRPHACRSAVFYIAPHTINASTMGLSCRCERICHFLYALAAYLFFLLYRSIKSIKSLAAFPPRHFHPAGRFHVHIGSQQVASYVFHTIYIFLIEPYVLVS